mgnify:CR=1 FL=1
MKLNNIKVIDVEVDGLDMKDYPDFVDAYISEAKFADTKQPLDDEQLGELQDQNPMEFHELVSDECLCIADKYYS